eukprot:10940792-Alexandrium_andersonii.AAC.1
MASSRAQLSYEPATLRHIATWSASIGRLAQPSGADARLRARGLAFTHREYQCPDKHPGHALGQAARLNIGHLAQPWTRSVAERTPSARDKAAHFARRPV